MTNTTEIKEKLKYGLYKYIHNGQIIYIGKSDKASTGLGIPQRIKDHSREAKFQPYLKESSIMFMSMSDCIDEIDANETLLIKQYAPILNVSDKPQKKSAQNYEATLLKTHKWEPFKEEYLNLNDNPIIKRKKHIVNSKIISTPKRNHLLEIYESLNVYKWIYKQITSNKYDTELDTRRGLVLNILVTEDCPDIAFMPLTGEGFADNHEFYWTNWVCTLHKNKNKNNENIYTVLTYLPRDCMAASGIDDVVAGIENSIITLEIAYKNILFKDNEIKDLVGFGSYIYDLGSLIQENQPVVDLCNYLQEIFKNPSEKVEHCGSKDTVRYEITDSEYIKIHDNPYHSIPLPKIKIKTPHSCGSYTINSARIYNLFEGEDDGHYYLRGYKDIKDDVSHIIETDAEMKQWYELLDYLYKNVA